MTSLQCFKLMLTLSLGLVLNTLTTAQTVTSKESVRTANRKGFIASLGGGPSLILEKIKLRGGSSTDLDARLGLQTEFTIGAGISDQLLIYWSSKINWMRVEVAPDIKKAVTFGQGGVGVSYFLKPTIKSPFVSAGLGFSTLRVLDENAGTNRGFGFYLGGGYEFSEHLLGQVNLVYGNPGHSRLGYRISFNTLAINVGVRYLWY